MNMVFDSIKGSSKKLGLIGEAVIFRHTLFSLPFVLMAIWLESQGNPELRTLLLILIAAASARNGANALNRIIDADIDKENPRTAKRHLPSGRLSKRALIVFTLCMGVLLLVSTALLNTLCLMLLPLAALLIYGYSYTKRFTWLCHYWLGITCSAATMGAFLALNGAFEFRYFILTGAVALWVSGFDILYALQDLEHDRAHGIFSIPARFGEQTARIFALLSHLGSLAALFLLPFFWNLGWLYWSGYLLAAVLMLSEHIVSLGKTAAHIRIASYTINEIIPVLLLIATLMDIYLVSA